MYKLFLIVGLLLFTSSILFSEDVLITITDETCACIEKSINTENNKVDNNLEMKLGLCIMEKSSSKKKEIFKSYKLDINKSEDFQKFAGQVGGKLALRCDKFVALMMDVMNDDDSDLKKAILEKTTVTVFEMTGTIQNFECNDFCKFTVKQGGSLHTIYLLDDIEGIDLINKSSMLIGEKFKLQYREMDVYSKELKGYIEIKVLTSIEMIKN